MIDPFKRKITYLRVSVTDRCDFRCTYCMPENVRFLPKREILSLEELNRLCLAFIKKGVKKIRITGGEPLVRKDVINLFQSLGKALGESALRELTLTTNGSQLERYADALFKAGVRRINISLDSLNPHRFRNITRRGDFESVMRGIEAASKAGLAVKINTVALRNVNDDEYDDLIRWCGDRKFGLTLIETMPVGDVDSDRITNYLPLSTVRTNLQKRWTMEGTNDDTGGPARYVHVKEANIKLGFITPMTHNFCESCNRVRLTCTGKLYMCLGQNDSKDLSIPLRASAQDKLLEEAIDEAIGRKPKGHNFLIEKMLTPAEGSRHMNVTGG